MGIIKQIILKCDKCGAEAKCGGFSAIEAVAKMKKRGWTYHYKTGTFCGECREQREPHSGAVLKS